jgi:N-acyl-D-amino-acid deacylase
MAAILASRGFRDLSFAVVALYRPDPSLNGLSLAQIATRRKGDGSADAQFESAREMLLEGGAQMVYHLMSDDDVDRIMRHPQVSIASDVITLEEAVRKMTSLPAGHFRLANRGLIRTGYAADLVVFDPASVADAATYESPHAYALGIPYVVVNGAVVVNNGTQTDARPGQVIANSLLERK